MDLAATTTIREPVPEVYAFWRDLENRPTFRVHLERVRATGDRASHWVAVAPFGSDVEWDAKIGGDAASCIHGAILPADGVRIGPHRGGAAQFPGKG